MYGYRLYSYDHYYHFNIDISETCEFCTGDEVDSVSVSYQFFWGACGRGGYVYRSFPPLKKCLKSIVKISNKHQFIEIYLLRLLSLCPCIYESRVLDAAVKV